MIETTPTSPECADLEVLAANAPPPAPRSAEPKRARILFFHPGPTPPNRRPEKNMLYHLSRGFEGDLVTTRDPGWIDDDGAARGAIRSGELGDFGFHSTASVRLPSVVRTLWNFCYFLGKGLSLSWSKSGYDVIVSYGPYTPSIAAFIVSRLIRAKLIIEVPGHPFNTFSFYQGPLPRIKERVARVLVPAMLSRADMVQLRYPDQLVDLPTLKAQRVAAFPNFVPVSSMRAAWNQPTAPADQEPFVLFLGFPWHLKGVDILIRAFLKIADRHPRVRLRIVGHCPDRTPYENLAGGHPRVALEKAVFPDQAACLMSRCSLFVLPSRTEAVARVLLEAMGARKPIICSRVGGSPSLIEDGQNGLLFESENVDDLAAKLDRLLADPHLADQLAAEGYRRVFELWSEEKYVQQFKMMIDRLGCPSGSAET
jgi:glycosyltransferase involved in cell wall biosynthesis